MQCNETAGHDSQLTEAKQGGCRADRVDPWQNQP
jgi:hypothetical protein